MNEIDEIKHLTSRLGDEIRNLCLPKNTGSINVINAFKLLSGAIKEFPNPCAHFENKAIDIEYGSVGVFSDGVAFISDNDSCCHCVLESGAKYKVLVYKI